jgi:hypothetical protein
VFDAICATLPLGSVAIEAEANERGQRYVWLKAAKVDRLGAMRSRELQRRDSQAGQGRGTGPTLKLFHYTPVYGAVMILRDGVIRRSTGKTPPYVWLSSNPIYEPRALAIRREHLGQMVDDERALLAFRGRARFVFHDGCEAIPYQNLPLPCAVRSDLESNAQRAGGRPEEWFAFDRDVRCAGLPLEIETALGWQPITHRFLKRRYAGLTKMPDGTLRLGRWCLRLWSASAARAKGLSP